MGFYTIAAVYRNFDYRQWAWIIASTGLYIEKICILRDSPDDRKRKH